MTEIEQKRRWVPQKRGWMPVVLGLSLAINLAVVAAVSGAAWRHKDAVRGGPHASSKGGALYIKALPREMRAEMREQMRGLRSDGGWRSDTSDMLAILRSTPFDPAAATAILDAERAVSLSRRNAATAAWLDQISAMTASERRVYADRLQELSDWRKSHKKIP